MVGGVISAEMWVMVILNEEGQPCFSCTGHQGAHAKKGTLTMSSYYPLLRMGGHLWYCQARMGLVFGESPRHLWQYLDVALCSVLIQTQSLGHQDHAVLRSAACSSWSNQMTIATMNGRSRRTLSSRGRRAAAESTKGWD